MQIALTRRKGAKMSIRKLSTINDATELNLSRTVIRAMSLKPMDVKTLIMLVRDERHLSLHAVGTRREEEVRNAVADAGFLLQESVEAQGIRRLLMAVFGRTSLSVDEYEAQTPFSDQQCSAFDDIIADFSKLERWVLEHYYGLSGTAPQSISDIARLIGCEYSVILGVRRKCLGKLRGLPLRRQLIETFSNFPAIAAEEVNRVQQQANLTGQTPIDDLGLSTSARRCLDKAKIRTVEQLQNLAPVEIINMSGVGDKIFAELTGLIAEFNSAPQSTSLQQSVRSLDLSNRAVNCLERAGIMDVDRLKRQTAVSLIEIRGMGVKTQTEILDVISRLES